MATQGDVNAEGKATLSVLLPKASFAPGELVRGSISLRTASPVVCSGVLL